MNRRAKVISVVFLIFACGFFVRICLGVFWEGRSDPVEDEVADWLRDNQLFEYRRLFKEKGEFHFGLYDVLIVNVPVGVCFIVIVFVGVCLRIVF